MPRDDNKDAGGAPAGGDDKGGAPAGADTKPDLGMGDLVDDPVDDKGGKDGGDKAYHPADLPDDMKGKTDRDTIDNLAKRAKGLRDALAKKPGAAGTSEDDYKLELPKEMAEKYDISKAADAPILKAAQKAALKSGLPKDMYNAFVGDIVSELVEGGVLKNVEPQTPEQLQAKARENAETELGKLAKAMGGRDKALSAVKEEKTWLAHQQKLGILTAGEAAEMYIVLGTAEGFNAWQKIRRMFTGHEIPAALDEPINGVESVKEARALFRDPRYQTDAAFREDAGKRLSAAVRASKGGRS